MIFHGRIGKEYPTVGELAASIFSALPFPDGVTSERFLTKVRDAVWTILEAHGATRGKADFQSADTVKLAADFAGLIVALIAEER